MDFSKLQKIWNEQDSEPLFAIDRTALSELVEKDGKVIRFSLRSFELVSIVCFFGVAIAVASEPFFEKHEYFQYYEAALFFLAAGVMYVRYRRRARQESEFKPNLLGDVDLAIWRLESLAMRLREYCWIAMTPIVVTGVIRMIFNLASKPLWLTIAWMLMVVFVPIAFHLKIRRNVEPKLRELQALRKTLAG